MLFLKRPSTMLCPSKIRKLFKDFHPHVNDPSVEHCVPRSLYKEEKQLGRDMHNLISMPRSLNSKRSNYKLVESIVEKQEQGAKKNTKNKVFVPPEHFRGRYARSIGYFFLLYPHYQDPIARLVLDPELLLRWNSEYPPSDTEMGLHERVSHLQSNENPLIAKSTRDDALHAIWITSKRRT